MRWAGGGRAWVVPVYIVTMCVCRLPPNEVGGGEGMGGPVNIVTMCGDHSYYV